MAGHTQEVTWSRVMPAARSPLFGVKDATRLQRWQPACATPVNKLQHLVRIVFDHRLLARHLGCHVRAPAALAMSASVRHVCPRTVLDASSARLVGTRQAPSA